jgi:hypothetical protein
MIPFHTFLALLALLVLSSCSQTSPPHTVVEKLSQSEATEAQGGSTNNTVTTNDGTNVIKPGPKNGHNAKVSDQSLTTSEFDLTTEGQIDFRVSGISAKAMFELMPIKAEPFTQSGVKYIYKNGVEVSCVQTPVEHYCTFSISTSDGSAIVAVDRDKVVHEDASSTFKKGAITPNLTGSDPEHGSIANLWMIIAKTSPDPKIDMNQNLYDALNVNEQSITISGDDSASEKEGKNIFCQKQTPTPSVEKKIKDGTVWFSCYVYIDVSTGSTSLTSVARPLF